MPSDYSHIASDFSFFFCYFEQFGGKYASSAETAAIKAAPFFIDSFQMQNTFGDCHAEGSKAFPKLNII
jgi:hypothetical protein